MPYWRLSSVYFTYFSVVGALIPFWGLYLQSLGFSAYQIGILAAVPMLTKLLSPNIWGWLADRTQARLHIVRLGSLGACLGFLGLLFFDQYHRIFIFTFIYSFFWNAVLPQIEVISVTFLNKDSHRYSQIRLWGSIGFMVMVLLLGYLWSFLSIQWLPAIVFVLLVTILLSTLTLPEKKVKKDTSSAAGFIQRLVKPGNIVFFVAMFLIQLSHGPYYTFYSIFLKEHGYSGSAISFLWVLGVLAEIVLFTFFPRVIKQAPLMLLLSVSAILTATRWMLSYWWVDNVGGMMLTQCLHAFSFGLTHLVAIEYIKRNFSDGCQSQGQAFYSAASHGSGAALGAYLSGVLWQYGAGLSFSLAALSALFASIIIGGYGLMTLNNRRSFAGA